MEDGPLNKRLNHYTVLLFSLLIQQVLIENLHYAKNSVSAGKMVMGEKTNKQNKTKQHPGTHT